MSEAASAPEMDPLIRRTEVLLEAGDYTQATRLRHLFQQATQYRHIAERRDGATTISSVANVTSESESVERGSVSRDVGLNGTLSVQTPTVQAPRASTPIPSLSSSPVNEPRVGSASGFLVQVYSARPNSPPYALTDEAGLTVAYVTPYPGVNLRNHLNSRIAVRGNEKLLQGMSTPHILVDRAERR